MLWHLSHVTKCEAHQFQTTKHVRLARLFLSFVFSTQPLVSGAYDTAHHQQVHQLKQTCKSLLHTPQNHPHRLKGNMTNMRVSTYQ